MEGPRSAYLFWSFATFHSLGDGVDYSPRSRFRGDLRLMEGPNERTALASTSQYSAIIRTNNCC
jgi:hypothetical protein